MYSILFIMKILIAPMHIFSSLIDAIYDFKKTNLLSSNTQFLKISYKYNKVHPKYNMIRILFENLFRLKYTFSMFEK